MVAEEAGNWCEESRDSDSVRTSSSVKRQRWAAAAESCHGGITAALNSLSPNFHPSHLWWGCRQVPEAAICHGDTWRHRPCCWCGGRTHRRNGWCSSGGSLDMGTDRSGSLRVLVPEGVNSCSACLQKGRGFISLIVTEKPHHGV